MSVNIEVYQKIKADCLSKNVVLVAVSKTKPANDIQELYDMGQRDFGENYVQELVDKQLYLPKDIRWHFIGHLQSNKVKYIIPFVHLIHGVDSFKLLKEINKYALKNNRIVDCLLQVHIAQEETKFGFDEEELNAVFESNINELTELKNIKISGMMGMASFSPDIKKIKEEYHFLKSLFDKYVSVPASNCDLKILSMGMSGDYPIAIEEGSNMVRVGSLIFGERNYQQT